LNPTLASDRHFAALKGVGKRPRSLISEDQPFSLLDGPSDKQEIPRLLQVQFVGMLI
jgi:hypothetical protein